MAITWIVVYSRENYNSGLNIMREVLTMIFVVLEFALFAYYIYKTVKHHYSPTHSPHQQHIPQFNQQPANFSVYN